MAAPLTGSELSEFCKSSHKCHLPSRKARILHSAEFSRATRLTRVQAHWETLLIRGIDLELYKLKLRPNSYCYSVPFRKGIAVI
jgi:hypothetical protein